MLSPAMITIKPQGSDVLLLVKVVPKSSRDRIVGALGGALKIAVAAPPEKGAANDAVCMLLAKVLGVHSRQVGIEAGHASPRKTVRITGIDADTVREKLAEAMTS